MFDVSGKNVVYVGGFSGIGYQVCSSLIMRKLKHLVICSRMENVEMLKKLQAECPTVKVHFVQINLMDRVLIEHAVKEVVGIVEYIDVLVNGAGVLADKDIETTIGVNLTGLIHTTMLCLPYMDKSQMGRGGIVVNISSVFGLEPASAVAVYAAAKHGVVGFTRSMADKHFFEKTGICFICICPGLTTTEQMVNLRANVIAEHTVAMIEAIEQAKHQTPKECALNVIKAMEMMKNGGIYVCNWGELKEVMPTVYWQM